jgi:hypothetical protein
MIGQRLALVLAAAALAGCIEHQARVSGAAPVPGQASLALVGDRVERPWSGSAVQRDPLAAELPVTLVVREGDGALRIATVRSASPKPMWQRFPMDVGTDLLWYGNLVSAATAPLILPPAQPMDRAALIAEAHGFGYASATAAQAALPSATSAAR